MARVDWTEPATYTTGAPILDLAATRLYVAYDGGAESLLTTVAASAETGGGAQSHTWTPPEGTTRIDYRVSAVTLTGTATFSDLGTLLLGAGEASATSAVTRPPGRGRAFRWAGRRR